MRATSGLTFASGIFAAGLLAACEPECESSAALVARIEALASGERILLDECVITEGVTVPAGAVVEGGTFVLASGASITLEPSVDGAPITTLLGTRVRGGAGGLADGAGRVRDGASVRVVGPGRARIEGVELEIERGIGIGVAQARVEIDGAVLAGNVDPATVFELPDPALPDAQATYGIAVIDSAQVTITDTAVHAWADAGVICSAATLEATSTELSESRGYGLRSFGCTVTLVDVDVHDTLGAASLPGVGIDAQLGTELTATRLALHDGPGFGLLVSASEATLIAPRIERMRQAGAWAERGGTLSITGGMLDDNAGAAIAAVGAAGLEVRDTSVRSTRTALIPSSSGAGAETMADAVHVAQLAGMPCTVTLADLTLVENARVGVVLDGAMEPLAVTIERTHVETRGTQLGAIAQDVAALPVGWDAGVVRVGSAATLDVGAGRVEVSGGSGLPGILMPPTLEI